MKKINIAYWVSIALILFFMVPGSIMNIMKTPDWVKVFNDLGYPLYLMPVLGFAKLAACLVLALPFFKLLKTWAYAGLLFDLVGATFSGLVVGGFVPQMLIMFFAILVIVASYLLWLKKTDQPISL